jgi:O-antigen/teichoic acid export membrane protein
MSWTCVRLWASSAAIRVRDQDDGDETGRADRVDRDETPHERWDRNFGEILQEVRVAQTGVQILFAFLLTLPFSARFDKTLPRDHAVYVVTLLASAAASASFLAPVSYHRVVFRQDRKGALVITASRLAQSGLAFLLVAIVGAVFMVMDVVIGLGAAVAAGAGVGVMCCALWYVLPIHALARRPPDGTRARSDGTSGSR